MLELRRIRVPRLYEPLYVKPQPLVPRRLRFEVDTSAPQDKLDLLLKLTERYCVVYQTIRKGPKVTVSMKRV